MGYGFKDEKGNKVIECGFDCCQVVLPHELIDKVTEELVTIISKMYMIVNNRKSLSHSETGFVIDIVGSNAKKQFRKSKIKEPDLENLVRFLKAINKIEKT